MDSAQPRRNDETGMFVCQFCGRDDFPELTEVSGVGCGDVVGLVGGGIGVVLVVTLIL